MTSKRGAVIVAHPDDETLFASTVPATFPDLRWDVICCSIPKRDPIRAWKFFAACQALGMRGVLMPFEEFNPINPDLRIYQLVVTHNVNGEYGHKHHATLHFLVRSWWPKEFWVFGYGARETGETVGGHPTTNKVAALACYDHVLPYNGTPMTKGEALKIKHAKYMWEERFIRVDL